MTYYEIGKLTARAKLGMVSPIFYTATKARDADVGALNKNQDFWKNFDDRPISTGEESALGMPSASKTGSENDYGYGAPQGSYGVGAQDANQHLADRDKRLSDAMQNAFIANQQYDASYAPESPMTQPHGPKMAAIKAPGIPAPNAMRGLKASNGRYGMNPPRLGGQAPQQTMGMNIKAPTSLSRQFQVGTNAARQARQDVHALQPAAVGANSARVPTVPTISGGAPVNPVAQIPDLTTTAQK